MNHPDAPVAHEGFFVTHFFTVRNQEISKDFYVRILGGKVIQAGESLLHQARQLLDRSQFRWRSDARQARGPSRSSSESKQSEQLPQSTCRGHLVLLQTMARQRRSISH